MADLVTLAEAKAHLNIVEEEADFDGVIALYISSASEAVLDVATGWTGDPEVDAVPDRLKLATLARVTVMFENRDSVAPGTGELPLLTPLRTLEL